MSGHESPIKTPKQLIIAVVLGFLVPIVVIVLLVKYVGAGAKPGAGSSAFTPEATAERIMPVGKVATEPSAGPVVAAAAGAGPKKPASAEAVYKAQCAACHAAGVLGAPKFGDKAAWAPRISKGYQALLTAVLKGKGAMPAQAGGQFSDEEIGAAVKHLTKSGGASF